MEGKNIQYSVIFHVVNLAEVKIKSSNFKYESIRMSTHIHNAQKVPLYTHYNAHSNAMEKLQFHTIYRSFKLFQSVVRRRPFPLRPFLALPGPRRNRYSTKWIKYLLTSSHLYSLSLELCL